MAPSIRVKRSAYSAIGDYNEPTEPRSLATIFSPSSAPSDSQHRETSVTQGSPKHDRNASTLPSRRLHRISSIMQKHCMNSQSLRLAQSPLLTHSRHSSPSGSQLSIGPPAQHSPQDNLLSAPGQNADTRTPAEGAPGLIESSLNLPRSDDWNDHLMPDEDSDHHHDSIVEHLDVIDPQIGTISHLTNTANAILIPPLSFYSRKPVVVLPDRDYGGTPGEEHEDALDRHVEDVLERPYKFRRTMLGVWSFLKTPLGIITGIYGFLVVFWGAALVIFLARIINLHNDNTQGFWVEVCSQVENGLFTVTGIGLIPYRVLDTHRVLKIWYYKRRTKKLRAKAGLPQLFDRDDLPDPMYDPNYVHVLTEKEEKDLHRQQVKFQHSQTWYRPHGTETHRAFPINIALLICCLNDGNSIFQILLCATMWGLNRFQRPAWSTGFLIPACFLCGILSGVFIWYGAQRTKRTAKVEEELRAALANYGVQQLPEYPKQQPERVDGNNPIVKSNAPRNMNSEKCATDVDVAQRVDEDVEEMIISEKPGPSSADDG